MGILKTLIFLKLRHVPIKFKDIPQEFVDGYNLKECVHNRWVYFEIVKGCYGLPQAGRLANDLLRERLAEEGYYEAETPGLWKHASRPIQCKTGRRERRIL